jgi:hypothetical protein
MYIAYSVLRGRQAGAVHLAQTNETGPLNTELQLRYQAYQDICNKYRHEITAIRKYFPNWRPDLPSL